MQMSCDSNELFTFIFILKKFQVFLCISGSLTKRAAKNRPKKQLKHKGQEVSVGKVVDLSQHVWCFISFMIPVCLLVC